MKIAVLSDIHSNVFALEAVIHNAKKHSVDLMANLGDILYGPIAPKSTYELLNEHEFITISGNQDRQIFEATPGEINSNPTMQFILNDLGSEPLNWLKSLPFDKQVNDDIYLCHGTPTNDLIYLLEDVSGGYARLRTDNEITTLLAGQKTELVCCGHTHTARAITLNNGQTIINPGSVGLPAYTDNEPVVHSMESFSNHASYSIVEKINGKWHIQNVKVPYNFELAVKESKNRNRTDWAHFLTTGRQI
jgi:putative phosphoesterase